MRNSKHKEQFTAAMVMFFLFSFLTMAVIIAVEVGNIPITLDVLLVNIFLAFVGEVAIAAFAVFLIIYVQWFRRHPSFGNLETWANLFFDRQRQNLALKNAQYIAPYLQAFLWQTLYRNKSVLGIDPGLDMGSLSPNSRRATYRNRTVYYVFELVMKNGPGSSLSIQRKSRTITNSKWPPSLCWAEGLGCSSSWRCSVRTRAISPGATISATL